MRIYNQNIKKNIFSIADNISISIYKLSMKYFNLLTESVEFNRNKHYICNKNLVKININICWPSFKNFTILLFIQ